MTDRGESNQELRRALQSIALMVHRDGVEPDEDDRIKGGLRDRGFSATSIGEALEWLERAAHSGSLMDALAMLKPASTAERIAHPAEFLGVNPELWLAIERCRLKGIFTNELAERILEGVRHMDTWDWDEKDVETFLSNVLTATNSSLARYGLSRLLSVRPSTFKN